MTKHTQGEWKINKDGCCIITDQPTKDWDKHYSSREREIESYGGDLVAESVFNESNAQLISAAPDLLEACKLAYKDCIGTTSIEEQINVIKVLQQAINKATGGI